MDIGVLNIGMGNLGSLRYALDSQGWDTVEVTSPNMLDDLSHLFLPGVGSFTKAMSNLVDGGFVEAIKDFADQGKPVMGICLGMHLLANTGEEGGRTDGLGLVPGTVTKFPKQDNLRLPHVGWNEVVFKNNEHPVLENIRSGVDFYFVHSYHFNVQSNSYVLGQTDYADFNFTSVVARKNVIGVQFHPEKSQSNGLRILDNFCVWDGQC